MHALRRLFSSHGLRTGRRVRAGMAAGGIAAIAMMLIVALSTGKFLPSASGETLTLTGRHRLTPSLNLYARTKLREAAIASLGSADASRNVTLRIVQDHLHIQARADGKVLTEEALLDALGSELLVGEAIGAPVSNAAQRDKAAEGLIASFASLPKEVQDRLTGAPHRILAVANIVKRPDIIDQLRRDRPQANVSELTAAVGGRAETEADAAQAQNRALVSALYYGLMTNLPPLFLNH
jgi:hypothetical protein